MCRGHFRSLLPDLPEANLVRGRMSPHGATRHPVDGAQMATPKVLEIKLDFMMSDRKIYSSRIKAVYEKAVEAAIEAAREELLDDSISSVHASMTWGYRWAQTSSDFDLDESQWEDDEEEPSEG